MKKAYSLTMLIFLIPVTLGGWSPKATADDSVTVHDSDGRQYVEFYVDSTAASNMSATSNGVTIRSEDLYDAKKWNYGVNYYLDNNYGGDVYAKVWVIEHTNVTGDVVSGNFLLGSGDTLRVGSFTATVYGKAWSVNVGYAWCSVDAPPEACPAYYGS